MSEHKRQNSSLSSTLATPNAPTTLTAQESREKRLAHQQTRFRDRGGVFVPQQRTNLLNILLGKTTLKKATARRSRSRSLSYSPVRRKSEKLVDSDQVSKAKKGRKSVVQAEDNQDEPVTGTKSAPVRKGRKKVEPGATRTKKSTTAKAPPNPVVSSDDLFSNSKPPAMLSNGTSTAATVEMDRKDVEEVAQGRKAGSKKTKAASSARAKGKAKGKPIATEESEEEDIAAVENKDTRTKTTRSKTTAKTRAQAKIKKKPINTSEPDPTSDIEQVYDVSDIPSSPLARRGKARAAARRKPYVDPIDEDDDLEEKLHPPKKVPAKAKSKASSSTRSKKSTKKQPVEDEGEEVESSSNSKSLPSKRGARSALTPVPEESEPESDTAADAESIARSAQELAAAISSTIKDFAPVSRDKAEMNTPGTKGKEKGTTVKRRKQRVASDDEDEDVVAPEGTAKKEKGNKEKMTVAQSRGRGKGQAKSGVGSATITETVNDPNEEKALANSKGRAKRGAINDEVGAKTVAKSGERGKRRVAAAEDDVKEVKNPRAGKGRNIEKGRTDRHPEDGNYDDVDQAPTAPASSPLPISPRSPKRRRDPTESDHASRTTKKAKTIPTVDAPASQSASATNHSQNHEPKSHTVEEVRREGGRKGLENKPEAAVLPDTDDVHYAPPEPKQKKPKKGSATSLETDRGNHKRKRVDAAEQDDDVVSSEPEPKRKKDSIASSKTGGRNQTKNAASISNTKKSPLKKLLKIASRKQKENTNHSASATADAAASSKSSEPTTKRATKAKQPSSTVRSKLTKRGPPQSVLDRIKKSASTIPSNGAHVVDDEPDELDFLS